MIRGQANSWSGLGLPVVIGGRHRLKVDRDDLRSSGQAVGILRVLCSQLLAHFAVRLGVFHAHSGKVDGLLGEVPYWPKDKPLYNEISSPEENTDPNPV